MISPGEPGPPGEAGAPGEGRPHGEAGPEGEGADGVLILRALGLGDFLTGVPAYRALRRAFPAATVTLAAPAALADLVPLTGAIDTLLPTGELEPVSWPGPPPAVGVDLHGRGPASHVLVAALRPRRLIVFGGPTGGGYAGPAWHAGEHEVARWCRLCAESGIPADPADLRLPAPAGAVLPAAAVRAARDGGATLVHPGAASPARRWPPGRFAAVAAALRRDGHRVLITGSAGERRLAERVAALAGLPASSVIAGGTSLAGLAAVAADARLAVSGDTGVAHLAVAYGRPSVTLYGPTPPAEWGPPPLARHQVLWPAAPGYRGDPHAGRTDPVLARADAAGVLAAAGRALDAGPDPPSGGGSGLAGRPSAR
jgi:ADP-heptose:LPS heptosyltransferase